MKAIVFACVCLLAVAQGRVAPQQRNVINEGSLAVYGENPGLVHLRLASLHGGILNSCTGVLIDNRWVLTTVSCLNDATYAWVRYGATNVLHPELVTETSAFFFFRDGVDTNSGLGLVNINRYVHPTDGISVVTLDTNKESAVVEGKVCGWGSAEDGGPGQELRCVEVTVAVEGNTLVAEFDATKYDVGTALVSGGKVVGLLSDAENGVFLRPANYLEWISERTGVEFESNDDDKEDEIEGDGDEDDKEDEDENKEDEDDNKEDEDENNEDEDDNKEEDEDESDEDDSDDKDEDGDDSDDDEDDEETSANDQVMVVQHFA